ncbi:MAG TPA: hypothetical protein VFL79_22295 [Terriglobia bacterium]|nr:hypothetical protein [Terriglobia bacterium]
MQAISPQADTFWLDFLHAREKSRILLLPELFPEPLATEDELFDLVLQVNKRHVPTPDDSKFKVYINHKLVTADILKAAPAKPDGSFHAYARRLETEMGAKQYLFFLEDIHRYSVPIWLRACKMLKQLFAHTGLPASHATVELFAGKYTRTSGGVHRELCSNFQYVVHGDKTMKVWDPDVFDPSQCYLKRPNGEQYLPDDAAQGKEHLGDAVTARPTQTMYWPARYWHTGESPEFTISLTIALYMENNMADTTLELLRERLMQRSAMNRVSYSLPFTDRPFGENGAALPLNPHTPAYEAIQQEIRSGDLRECLEDAWYKRASALGFEWTPYPLEEKPALQSGSSVVMQAPAGIFHRPTAGGTRVFANGYCLDTSLSQAEVRSLIDLLGTGERVTLRKILPSLQGSNGSLEERRRLIEELAKLNAVQISNTEDIS